MKEEKDFFLTYLTMFLILVGFVTVSIISKAHSEESQVKLTCIDDPKSYYFTAWTINDIMLEVKDKCVNAVENIEILKQEDE